MNENILQVECVNHWFNHSKTDRTKYKISANHILYDINLQIKPGEIVSLVGPSGCGKSTLLRTITGTHPPKRGRIILNIEDRSIQILHPRRDIGVVYQQYSLLYFLTAQKIVALGLKLDKTTIPQRMKFWKWLPLRKKHLIESAELLSKVKLEHAINLYPDEMSGGMRQRVALAQALIMKPKILLLDEPFGALDEATRSELRTNLRKDIKSNTQKECSVIIVTHELDEAIYVGDRVVGLSQHWDWKSKGFKSCPGATIVYNKSSPVFGPNNVQDFETFMNQKKDIQNALKGTFNG